MADDQPVRVVEVAKYVAAPRGNVVDDLAVIVIAGDECRWIGGGLSLKLVNEPGHRLGQGSRAL
jgi:hypothetical protein